jgi:hypothetical protein
MTWADLLQSIPFRLNRDDLAADFVEEMANEQITMFGPQLFAPSEYLDYSINTQPGQNMYPLPAGFQSLTFVRILFNGIWINVPIAIGIEQILYSDPVQPPFTSLPASLCRVFGSQIRLFPTPNISYPVELTIFGTVPGPTDPNDSTNFWVTDGNIFLRAATCLAICQEYLDTATPQSPRIAMWQQRMNDALSLLQTQAHARTQPSWVRYHL